MHRRQEERGEALRPIRLRKHDLRLGSVRLPAPAAKRLRRQAKRAGIPFAEALRRAIGAGLLHPQRLADLDSKRTPTVRLGALPMPAALAERLNVAAQQLGLPASEVIRRALEYE